MKAKQNPAPRANAESRANVNAELKQDRASMARWEADAAAILLACPIRLHYQLVIYIASDVLIGNQG